MQADPLSLLLHLLIGALVLILGRRLFWLFVAVAGFFAAFQAVPELLPDQTQVVVLGIALAAGVVGALLAIFLQYLAAGLAGFVAGGFAAQSLQSLLGPDLGWILFAVGGGIGLVLVLLAFDWALILLSALIGARIMLEPFAFEPVLRVGLLLGLAVLGVAVQAASRDRNRARS